MAVDEHTKVCKACGETFPLSAFPILASNHKPAPRCGPCHRAQQRAYVASYRLTRPIESDGIRICKGCKQIKALTEFPIQHAAKQGRMSRCKGCENAKQRAWRKKAMATRPDFVAARQLSQDKHKAKKYGLSAEEYTALEAMATGKCEICQKPPRGRNAWRADSRLHIDHCHETGKVRGLLCTDCNRALGLFGDDPKTLKRAAAYLCKP